MFHIKFSLHHVQHAQQYSVSGIVMLDAFTYGKDCTVRYGKLLGPSEKRLNAIMSKVKGTEASDFAMMSRVFLQS